MQKYHQREEYNNDILHDNIYILGCRFKLKISFFSHQNVRLSMLKQKEKQ